MTTIEALEYLQEKRQQADQAWKEAFKLGTVEDQRCAQARAFGTLLGAIEVAGWALLRPDPVADSSVSVEDEQMRGCY